MRASPSPASRRAAARVPAPWSADALAPMGRRAVAFTVDVLALVAAVALGFALGQPVVPVLVVVGQWLAEAVRGATVGNGLTGIRTVSARTSLPAGLVAVLVRTLVLLAGALVLLVGAWVVAVSGVWDSSSARRGWHDKASRTVMLRAGAVPSARAPSASAWSRSPAIARLSTTAEAPGLTRPAPPSRTVVPSTTPTSAPAPALITGMPGELPPRIAPPVAPSAPSLIEVPRRLVAGPPTPVVPTRAVLAPTPAPGGAPRIGGISTRRPDGLRGPELRPGDPGMAELEHARVRPDAPAARATPPGFVLHFDTGERVEVRGDGLVGRSPRREEGVTHVVAIDDPDRSISKVHLAFGRDRRGSRMWVLDRGSTNGTILVSPDGTETALPAGRRAKIEAGWTVRFGQRSLEVRSVAERDAP